MYPGKENGSVILETDDEIRRSAVAIRHCGSEAEDLFHRLLLNPGAPYEIHADEVKMIMRGLRKDLAQTNHLRIHIEESQKLLAQFENNSKLAKNTTA
jgi:hypothetical protein